MDKLRRRTGRSHGCGDFATDMPAFAHAGNDHAPRNFGQFGHGLLEIIPKRVGKHL